MVFENCGASFVVVYWLVREGYRRLIPLILWVRIKSGLLVEFSLLSGNRIQILGFGALDILDNICEAACHRRPTRLRNITFYSTEGYNMAP